MKWHALHLVLILAALLAEPKPPRVQWLMFTMDGCPPCAAAKADFRPWLERSKWEVSPVQTAHVRLLDSELDAELFAEFGVKTVPTFVLLVDGEPVETHRRYPGRQHLVKAYLKEFADLKGKQ